MNKLVSRYAPIVLALISSALAGAPSDLASGAAKRTFSRDGETPAVLAQAAEKYKLDVTFHATLREAR